MALKRVFAGFYSRYDGKPIFVVRVLRDINTGESIVVCKDASYAKEDSEHYYLIRCTSFCDQVEVDGVLRDKYIRQTRREVEPEMIGEVTEDGFPEHKSKPFTYVDDEYVERAIRCSRTYYEYTKDICENYRMICGDTNSSGNGSSTSAYPTARHIRPRARILRLPSSRSKQYSTTTPISSGNAFPRGCPSAKQQMPCSRTAA